MNVLLDTHIWIWWLLGSERLLQADRDDLDQLASKGRCHLAAMSLWEAQMLHSKGRLTLDRPFATWLREASAPGLVVLHPLDVEVVVALDQLPTNFHGDPADRLIVATALAHRLHLATQDRAIRSSGIVPIWEKPG